MGSGTILQAWRGESPREGGRTEVVEGIMEQSSQEGDDNGSDLGRQ